MIKCLEILERKTSARKVRKMLEIRKFPEFLRIFIFDLLFSIHSRTHLRALAQLILRLQPLQQEPSKAMLLADAAAPALATTLV